MHAHTKFDKGDVAWWLACGKIHGGVVEAVMVVDDIIKYDFGSRCVLESKLYAKSSDAVERMLLCADCCTDD